MPSRFLWGAKNPVTAKDVSLLVHRRDMMSQMFACKSLDSLGVAHPVKGGMSPLCAEGDNARTVRGFGVDVACDIHFLKGYTVFNVEQIEGLPAQYTAPASPRLDVSCAASTSFAARQI